MANDASRRWLPAALIVFVSIQVFAASSPTTTPVGTDTTVYVHLENPSPHGKCFLDLDTGQTFSFAGHSDGWTIRKDGIDVLCETREPANGLAIYDLTLVNIAGEFDDPREYRTLHQQVASVQSNSFDFVTIETSVPKLYAFRTHDDAIGVIELSRKDDGLNLRYRLVLKPTPPPLASRRIILARKSLENTEALLAKMKLMYGANHPAVVRLEKQVKALREMAAATTQPVLLQTAQLQTQLDQMRLTFGKDHPVIRAMEARLKAVKEATTAPAAGH